ncbi:MAG: hypothetical protein WAT79_00090 [Saprospiraceae bacterium]
MKSIVSLFLILNISFPPSAWSQKYDYTWILGYEYNTSKEGGFDDAAEGMILRFNQSPPLLEKHPIPFEMLSSSVLSHPETGELMFYTNGCRIMDKNHHIMENVYKKHNCSTKKTFFTLAYFCCTL